MGLVLLCAVFIGDALIGFLLVNRAIKTEVFAHTVDGEVSSKLLRQSLKPTFVKEFVMEHNGNDDGVKI